MLHLHKQYVLRNSNHIQSQITAETADHWSIFPLPPRSRKEDRTASRSHPPICFLIWHWQKRGPTFGSNLGVFSSKGKTILLEWPPFKNLLSEVLSRKSDKKEKKVKKHPPFSLWGKIPLPAPEFLLFSATLLFCIFLGPLCSLQLILITAATVPVCLTVWLSGRTPRKKSCDIT